MVRANYVVIACLCLLLVLGKISYSQNTYLLLKDVSGGELHTLVLMKNGTLWACGDNTLWQLGIGQEYSESKILRQVLDGDMETDSGFLENIVGMDAGWYHSLAMEPNGLVWAWGSDYQGQLGNGDGGNSAVPKRVHKGEMETTSEFLMDIVSISAGRLPRLNIFLTKKIYRGRLYYHNHVLDF